MNAIEVYGAKTHNLRNIDVEIPLGKFTVITGPSGSGKSSLAMDTIFAEGQRQYIESLSIDARQFFDQIPKPDVEQIKGLPPMLAIDQRHGNANPRSTVGTLTEIHDHLRVLFARIGEVRCFNCDIPIHQIPLEKIRDDLLRLPERTKVMVLSPIVRGQKGKQEAVFQKIRKSGLIRVRVDGEVVDIENLPVLSEQKKHTIEAVTDRIIIREDIDARLFEAIETAAQLSDGLVTAAFLTPENRDNDQWEESVFNSRHGCPNCSTSYAEIEPRTFSFNSPYGACSTCTGIGSFEQFDSELAIPNKTSSLSGSAVQPWKSLTQARLNKQLTLMEPLLKQLEIDPNSPIENISSDRFTTLWLGRGKEAPGIRDMLEREFATTKSSERIDELANYRMVIPCSDCKGTRLSIPGNSVFIEGKTIADICRLSLAELQVTLSGLKLDESKVEIASELLSEILTRIEYLQKVGLRYLNLDRTSTSLSGGELQRVRLATAIGTGLTGVCYILDEPSIGLHPRDSQRLIETLRDLQSRGNTVLVVEHDADVMRACDWLIDVGPAAGIQGGEIVLEKTPQQILSESVEVPQSVTADYLKGEKSVKRPFQQRAVNTNHQIVLAGATGNNLKNVTLELPLERLVAVTGVSGSGKSSLIRQTLYPAVAKQLGLVGRKALPFDSVTGLDAIDKLIWVDQKPIGRSPRSCLATYCGAMSEIRKIYAATKLAKSRGFSHTRFSFNHADGQCAKCEGSGSLKIEMNFLSDVYVICDECRGRRFNSETLRIKFKDQSIADVLEMQVDAALDFFSEIPKIHSFLSSFSKVGLGYLALGQPSTTLSGGEAQRVKLATELARRETGKTLYLLDEPTTGLHFEDVQRLIDVLDSLVEYGNSVVVIEHHLDVIKCADWVIDLGPEGGEAGGEIVCSGTPNEIATVGDSWTGRHLKEILA